MKNVYIGVVDTEIPSTLEVEKCRLINKLQVELNQPYMINFKEESLDAHPYVITMLLDEFKREDNQYSWRGFLVGRAELIEKLKDRYRALVLECTVMDKIPTSFKVLEFTEESE